MRKTINRKTRNKEKCEITMTYFSETHAPTGIRFMPSKRSFSEKIYNFADKKKSKGQEAECLHAPAMTNTATGIYDANGLQTVLSLRLTTKK